MLHSIGKTERSEELVELLLACHGRIRSFLAMAVAVGERADASEHDVLDGSERVRRYFSVALPLHVADEEEGVFPSLCGRSPEIDIALERMCDEHERHGPPMRRLLDASGALSANPRDASARTALAAAARELDLAFAPHLLAEETVIFPAIRALLTPEEQRALVGQLRARRQPP